MERYGATLEEAPDWLTPYAYRLLDSYLGVRWRRIQTGRWLTVGDIPYLARLNEAGTIPERLGTRHGAITVPLALSHDEVAAKPPEHWVVWNGAVPRNVAGKALRVLAQPPPRIHPGVMIHLGTKMTLARLQVFSRDPPGGYRNYLSMVEAYVCQVAYEAEQFELAA